LLRYDSFMDHAQLEQGSFGELEEVIHMLKIKMLASENTLVLIQVLWNICHRLMDKGSAQWCNEAVVLVLRRQTRTS